jgi:hypothetical protein
VDSAAEPNRSPIPEPLSLQAFEAFLKGRSDQYTGVTIDIVC